MKKYNLENGEVWFVSLKEFKETEEFFSHKKELLISMEPVRYSKVETFSNGLIGTMRIPKVNDRRVEILTFGYLLNENKLIFIDDEGWVEKTFEKIEESVYTKYSINQIMVVLFELLLDEDVLHLQHMEESLGLLEEELLEQVPHNFYEVIIQYRKQLTLLHSYYEQLMNVGDSMENRLDDEDRPENDEKWQHYINRTERLHNHVETLREYLIQIRELYQSMIDVQQNRVMSFLTIVTTIFLPLTLIAGWYGMNFPNMPEFGWKYGYLAIIAVSVFIIIAEIIYFKRKKML